MSDRLLVLVRHGQSEWNLKNLFTGWKDPDLTPRGITEAKQAEEIVASGKADMVALARGMLYDPRWGWHAAAELGGQVEAPPQYWRSQPSTQKALFGETRFGAR